MKAVFLTTATNEVDNHVQAWDCMGERCTRITFVAAGIPDDESIIAQVKKLQPKVIFYIGAVNGFGLPSVHTFQTLRKFAKVVNFCSDAADKPWHPVLDYYKRQECFDLQVSIDGAMSKHVDHATITPVDPALWEGPEVTRDIELGFSGSAPRGSVRSMFINRLKFANVIETRARQTEGKYADHVAFMKRCRSILNISITGSGQFKHVKGRVPETGWAKACLFETGGSPADQFLPKDSFVSYDSATDVLEALKDIPRLKAAAELLALTIREKYTPQKIYGEILDRINLRADFVGSAEPKSPA